MVSMLILLPWDLKKLCLKVIYSILHLLKVFLHPLCFFIVWRSAMSSGGRMGYSKALATYLALRCWKSLIEESIRREDLFNTKVGFQA